MTATVFYNTDDAVEVGPDWYEKLKTHAHAAENKRARLCLHHGPGEPVHEMIIVFHRAALNRPHRHRGKSESYHVLFGELDILLFDESGRPIRLVRMGDIASSKTQVYRMSSPIWHSVIIRSEYAAIHEVTNGPFRAEESEFASWAPEDPGSLRSFLKRSVKTLSQG
jgi:cupin fold WbuC family metalloprotein